MRFNLQSILVVFTLTLPLILQGQVIEKKFERIELRFDSLRLNYTDLKINDEHSFFLPIRQEKEEVELRFYPHRESNLVPFAVLEGRHYEQTDSLLMIGNAFYRVRLNLKNMAPGQGFSVLMAFEEGTERSNYEINIHPYLEPKIALADEETEVFRGEEKSIEIISPHAEYFILNDEWVEGENYDYWLRRESGKLSLSLRGKTIGNFSLEIPTKVQFSLPVDGKISNTAPTISTKITIKPSRLRFLNIDRENIFFDSESRSAGEVQIDYDPRFKMKTAYRIEDVNESSGRLVAEIIPKSTLGNDKILCEVYSYSHHRNSDGYLYIKDGNRTLAMTNFNVVNRPQIQEISLMREGGDWTENLAVYPGETVELRIRGNGLSISNFDFTPCEYKRDTVRISDRITFYSLRIPKNIDRKKVSVFLNDDITQYELLVREYKRPASLDFVSVDYGTGRIPITDESMDKPVFYKETIQEITFYFDRAKIDTENRLNGIQDIEIEVRILSQDNKLIDIQTIHNITICPDESSPRYSFYEENGCDRTSISLNAHLLRKTFTLDAFDQVVINIRHRSGTGRNERIHIYAERKFNFDLDVSFPAGLLVGSIEDPSLGTFTGVSTAFMAQFKFYSRKRFGQLSPFQVGAGFLALNAFNFAENAQRDLGIVVLGSIVPLRKKTSFSVPIYLGGGYLFTQNQFIFIFGPGLQVRF
jgi:hypothetical protein